MDDQAFQVAIQEDGTVRAGGLSLGRVCDGRLVIPDRYRARCLARGTDEVAVDLVEFIEQVILYIRYLEERP